MNARPAASDFASPAARTDETAHPRPIADVMGDVLARYGLKTAGKGPPDATSRRVPRRERPVRLTA